MLFVILEDNEGVLQCSYFEIEQSKEKELKELEKENKRIVTVIECPKTGSRECPDSENLFESFLHLNYSDEDNPVSLLEKIVLEAFRVGKRHQLYIADS